jgi:hypothetical protein
MSFPRLIFYNAMLGGWAAFAGWLLSEMLFLRRSSEVGWLAILATASLVGAAVGFGLAFLGTLTTGQLRGQLGKLGFCLAGGLVGGLVGGGLGYLIAEVMPRAFGWMVMGLGIGSVEGLFDRPPKKLRNGLIGGALGGLLGGFLFGPVVQLVGGNMSGRAVGFVLLGLAIGLFIGLAQIILREAWLTVEEGFRPGRQLILDLPVTALGTSEKAQLAFIAFGAKGVEPVHVKIVREPDGRFMVRDNGSRSGTFLNGEQIDEELLTDDDVIQLGVNKVRFHEAVRHVANENEARRKRAKPPGAKPPAVPAAAPAASAGGPPPLPVATMAPPIANPPPAPKAVPATPAASVATPKAPVRQPAPPLQPAAVHTLPPKPAPVGPRGKPCPKCGKPATPIPGAAAHLCMSCDFRF